jgi:hypothetical protein
MRAMGETRTYGQGKVTVRLASRTDASRLDRLAALDSSVVPAGSALVAEVDGELVAALPLRRGNAIADPFRRTTEIVRLLELRAAQLRGGRTGRARPRLARRSWARASSRPARA